MKYIITGGAGFIGSHLAEYLAPDHEVILIDNLFSGKMENIRSLPIRFVQGTLSDLSFLKEFLKGQTGYFIKMPSPRCRDQSKILVNNRS